MSVGDIITLPQGACFGDWAARMDWVDCSGLVGEVTRVTTVGEGRYAEMAWVRLPEHGSVPFSVRKLEEWAEAAA